MKALCATLTAVALALGANPATAQRISGSVAYYRSGYDGGEYVRTDGDWQAEATLRYHFPGALRVGVGASVGKLDEPFSDPSLTSIAVYFEPSLRLYERSRVGVWLGGRYGWAQERVGEQEAGLWASGWEAGGAGGVDFAVGSSVGLVLQAEVTRLDLARDAGLPTLGLPIDREGWRYSLGLGIRVGA